MVLVKCALKGKLFVVCVAIFFTSVVHAQTKVYWTDITPGPKIQRSNLDGTGVEIIVDWPDLAWNSVLPWMEGLSVDSQAGKIYWVGAYSPGGRVQRANLDGSDQEILIEEDLGRPLDVVLHFEESKMYWTTTGWIRRANLDGSDVEDVVDLEGRTSNGLAINPIIRKIYWTDSDDTIKRANLDGSGVETIVPLIFNVNSPLVIDPLRGKIYWIDGDTIRRVNMDGTNAEALRAVNVSSMGLAINFSEEKMYWSDFGSSIWKANLDGSNVEVVQSLAYNAIGIALDNQRGAIPLPLSTPASLLILSFLLGIVGLAVLHEKGSLSLARSTRYNRPLH